MITEKRAIEILKVQRSFLADINIDALISYKLAIDALEKQTSMSVGRVIIDEHEHETCPVCGKFAYSNYCSGCGQKLDWN